MLSRVEKVCKSLNKTYNANVLDEYPDIRDIFFQVRDMYEEDPNKFPDANKTFMSLLYNLANSEYQPEVDYITGPGQISKYKSVHYGKTIYLFGENDHGNKTGCFRSDRLNQISLRGKKHANISKYLLALFESSPVFIDFYIELGIMLDSVEDRGVSSGRTLWDMLSDMKGCFGPLKERECIYNVRMHGVDSRNIFSLKYKTSMLSDMDHKLALQYAYNIQKLEYMDAVDFSTIYKDQIDKMEKVMISGDIINIIIDDIYDNSVIMKELSRTSLDNDQIIDFFVVDELNRRMIDLQKKFKLGETVVTFIRKWFISLKTTRKWPNHLDIMSIIMTTINAVQMDVYTVSRMFKKFKVKDSEYYPEEPSNIIYYAGGGHTKPMGEFLEKIGFRCVEDSGENMLSCVSMVKIKQPLFT